MLGVEGKRYSSDYCGVYTRRPRVGDWRRSAQKEAEQAVPDREEQCQHDHQSCCDVAVMMLLNPLWFGGVPDSLEYKSALHGAPRWCIDCLGSRAEGR